MRAVSNTTPLRYLIAIGQEHLLGELSGLSLSQTQEYRFTKSGHLIKRVSSLEGERRSPLWEGATDKTEGAGSNPVSSTMLSLLAPLPLFSFWFRFDLQKR